MKIIRFVFLWTVVLIISSCSSRAKLYQKKTRISKDHLIQNYKIVDQSSYCGREPIVRFVDFEFKKMDSLEISIDITTSLAEGKINGNMAFLTDTFELEYKNQPNSRPYVETLETESQTRFPTTVRGRSSLINVLLRANTIKSTHKRSEKQYWNSFKIKLEKEDEQELFSSDDIVFSIQTENCELIIYPSYSQIRDLKLFLK